MCNQEVLTGFEPTIYQLFGERSTPRPADLGNIDKLELAYVH